MPYKVYKVKGGYKVGKSDGSQMKEGRKYASDKPLSKTRAESQMKVIYASEKGYEISPPGKRKTPLALGCLANDYPIGKKLRGEDGHLYIATKYGKGKRWKRLRD